MRLLKQLLTSLRREFHPDYVKRVVVLVDVNQSIIALDPFMNDVASFADEQRRLGTKPDGVLDFAGGNHPRTSLVFYIDKREIKPDSLILWLKEKGITATLNSNH